MKDASSQTDSSMQVPGLSFSQSGEVLRVEVADVSSGRFKLVMSFVFANLAIMLPTLYLMSFLYDSSDTEGQGVAIVITLLMLVLINGFWAWIKLAAIKSLFSRKQIRLTPHLLQCDNWFLPTHLLLPPSYADGTLLSYEGLKLDWKNNHSQYPYLHQLFISETAYQGLAQRLQQYLSESATAIEHAAAELPSAAADKLAPPPKSRMSLEIQNGVSVIEIRRDSKEFWSVGYIVFLLIALAALMIPMLMDMSFLLEMGWITIVSGIFLLLGLVPMSWVIYKSVQKGLRQVSLELKPEQLVLSINQQVREIPWSDIQAIKLEEREVSGSDSRVVINTLSICSGDQDIVLHELVDQIEQINQLVWLKDMLKRVWHQNPLRVPAAPPFI